MKALTQFSTQFISYLRNTLNLVQKCTNNVQSANSNGPGLGVITQLIQAAMTANSEQANDILLNVIDEMVSDPSKLFLKLNAMCILYHHLIGNLDQRLFSSIIDNIIKVNLYLHSTPLVLISFSVAWGTEKEEVAVLLLEIFTIHILLFIIYFSFRAYSW